MSMTAKTLKERRMVRQWLKNNKPKQCPVHYGEPIHSMTVVSKSSR